MESELAHENLKDRLLILDTYFYPLLANNETGKMNEPLVNYDSVRKVYIL